jgi:uncharacterized protein
MFRFGTSKIRHGASQKRDAHPLLLLPAAFTACLALKTRPFSISVRSLVLAVASGVMWCGLALSVHAQADPQSARSTLPTTVNSPLPSSSTPRVETPVQKPLKLQSHQTPAKRTAKSAAERSAEEQLQTQPVSRNAKTLREANSGVVSVVSGGADGTYIRIASDMANLLDDGNRLRILPIIGRGSLQNIRDILFLKGIDIGILQMDAREGLRGTDLYDEAVNQVRFIARLYNEEVHILANKDIKGIRDLSGKKVNIDLNGSGTNLTAKIIFKTLGITPEFTTADQLSAFERLKNGDIQAAVFVAGRPVRGIGEFKADERFHILPIPFDDKIAEIYLPARLTAADYPQLIENGKPVDTLAVGNLLAVYNWPEKNERYERVSLFVNALFSKFDEFLKPGRHPKWREINLAADVPGWKRFKPAQLWLDKMAKEKEAASGAAAGKEPTKEPVLKTTPPAR